MWKISSPLGRTFFVYAVIGMKVSRSYNVNTIKNIINYMTTRMEVNIK